MAYTVNYTDPFTTSFNISDNDINGPTIPIVDESISNPDDADGVSSLLIYGKGVANYGERIQENLLHMLENFSGATQIANPIKGQLWFSNYEHVRDGANWYRWDGTVWQDITADVPVVAPPNSNPDGSYWLDGTTLKRLINQADHPLTGLFIEVQYLDLASAPGFDINTYVPNNVMKIYDGATWTDANNVRVSPVDPMYDNVNYQAGIGSLWFDTTENVMRISLDGITYVQADPDYLRRDGSLPMLGILDAGAFTISNLAPAPILDNDATPKLWVENLVSTSINDLNVDILTRTNWREPVRITDITTYANVASIPTTGIIDGITVADGDRVLFASITATTESGVYIWDSGTTSWLIDLANNPSSVPADPGDTVVTLEGTYANVPFTCQTNTFWSPLQIESTGNDTYEVTGLTGNPTGLPLGTLTYTVGEKTLFVYLNGQKMRDGTDYLEVAGGGNIDWIGIPLVATDVLEFYSNKRVVLGTKLSDIPNVQSGVPTAGDTLVYNDTTEIWETTPIVGLAPGRFYDELNQNGLGTNSTFTTANVTCTVKSVTRSFIQVFVNGLLQKEGTGPGDQAYYVNASNQIIFNVGFLPPANADVTIYQL